MVEPAAALTSESLACTTTSSYNTTTPSTAAATTDLLFRAPLLRLKALLLHLEQLSPRVIVLCLPPTKNLTPFQNQHSIQMEQRQLSPLQRAQSHNFLTRGQAKHTQEHPSLFLMVGHTRYWSHSIPPTDPHERMVSATVDVTESHSTPL